MIFLFESQCNSLYQICRREGKFVTFSKSLYKQKLEMHDGQIPLQQAESTEDRTTNFVKHTNIATQTKIVIFRLNILIVWKYPS